MEENQNNNQEEAPVDRNDRAKAFFRAMYAGGEPDPDQFGIDVGQKQAQADAVSQAAVAHLETQLKEAEQRAVEAENLYKRLAADFENYRKRIDREREEFLLNGMQRAFEAILPALDDLDMAQSKLTEKTDSKVMFDSMKMVFTRLNRCLEQVGIKQMDVIGQPFDPRFHEPVQEVPTREVPEGAVVHQLRAGWNFKEKILRPALVNVATAPGDDAPPAPEEPAVEAVEEKVEAREDEFVRPTAQEVVSQTGVETSDTLDVLDNPAINRSTQDLPIEEIKAAIAEAEALEAAVAATTATDEEAEGKPGKVYDLTDVEE